MQKCKEECGFTLPVIYPYFVTKPLDLNFVENVIHNNRCDFPGAFTTVKHFIKFLFEMKACIVKFLVVITRLRFITLWIFCMSGLTINTPLNFVTVVN